MKTRQFVQMYKSAQSTGNNANYIPSDNADILMRILVETKASKLSLKKINCCTQIIADLSSEKSFRKIIL